MTFTPDKAHALLTVEQTAAADRAGIASGIAGIKLMAAAGNAVFEAIVNRFAPQPTLVLCGPGNNGGDGYVVAEKLRRAGWEVVIGSLVDTAALKGDAAWAASLWRGQSVRLKDVAILEGRSLVVDALFGAGLTRPLDGIAKSIVEAIDACEVICIGVDVPSGIDGNTGKVLGAAPHCRLTVTFFRAKPGHLLLPGRMFCGETIVADIGIPASVLEAIEPNTWRNHPSLWRSELPTRRLDDHKYRRGHALIYGGARLTGAARLAALAARRTGAGLVTIAAPVEAADIYRAGEAGTIVADCEFPSDYQALLADRRFNAIVLGPGLGRGEGTRRKVLQTLGGRNEDRSFVLDADALTSFADQPQALFDVLDGRCILTPHDGEFHKLFKTIASDLNKLEKVRQASALSGAIVLVKGADTVIAAPDGRAIINANALASLAAAGSGDVLSGIIGGLLAQGMEPFLAAAAGAYLHGQAGQIAGPNLIAEDLTVALNNSWKTL